MKKNEERALKGVMEDIRLTTVEMERNDASEFYGILADWAYAQCEMLQIEDEIETVNTEE